MSIVQRWESTAKTHSAAKAPYTFKKFFIAWPICFIPAFWFFSRGTVETGAVLIYSLMVSGFVAAGFITRKRNPRYAALKNQRKRFFGSNNSAKTVDFDRQLIRNNRKTLQEKVDANLELIAEVTNHQVKDKLVELYDRLSWTASQESNLDSHVQHRMLATSIADSYLPVTVRAFVELDDQNDPRAVAYANKIIEVLGTELIRLNRAIDHESLDQLTTNNDVLSAMFARFGQERTLSEEFEK